jgi:hypothetical protein
MVLSSLLASSMTSASTARKALGLLLNTSPNSASTPRIWLMQPVRSSLSAFDRDKVHRPLIAETAIGGASEGMRGPAKRGERTVTRYANLNFSEPSFSIELTISSPAFSHTCFSLG